MDQVTATAGEQPQELSAPAAGEQALDLSPVDDGQQSPEPSPAEMLDDLLEHAFGGDVEPAKPVPPQAPVQAAPVQAPIVAPLPTGAPQPIAQQQPAPQPQPVQMQPQQQPAQEVATVQEWQTAPQHWPVQEQEQFNALPENQRQFIYNSVTSASRAADEKMRHASELRQTVADFVGRLPQPQQQTQPPAQQQPQQEIPPVDPVERIKWDAKQEIREELQQDKIRQQEAVRLTAIADLNRRVEADPLQGQTRQIIDSKVSMEPEIVNPNDPKGRTYQQIEYDRLNNDPVYFESIYTLARNMVLRNQPPAPVAGQPAPVRTAHAPRLEAAGTTVPLQPLGSAAEQKRQDIATAVRRGKATPQTLSDYLDAAVGENAFV